MHRHARPVVHRRVDRTATREGVCRYARSAAAALGARECFWGTDEADSRASAKQP